MRNEPRRQAVPCAQGAEGSVEQLKERRREMCGHNQGREKSGGPIARGLQGPASFTRPRMKRHVQILDRPLRLRTRMA